MGPVAHLIRTHMPCKNSHSKPGYRSDGSSVRGNVSRAISLLLGIPRFRDRFSSRHEQSAGFHSHRIFEAGQYRYTNLRFAKETVAEVHRMNLRLPCKPGLASFMGMEPLTNERAPSGLAFNVRSGFSRRHIVTIYIRISSYVQ